MEAINEDISEYERLIGLATRPAVLAALQNGLAAANAALTAANVDAGSIASAAASDTSSSAAGAACADTTAAAAAMPATQAVPPVHASPAPLPVPTPTPVAAATASGIAGGGSGSVRYESLGKWGWSQSKEFVEVDILDGLTGVGALPRESVVCDFTRTSFDLRVHGLGGKNLRLRVTNLEKDIDPARSRAEVKRNRVCVRLRKTGEWDHWAELTARRARRADDGSAKRAEDPSAALLDVMRDLYEDGDDNTRKVIAEAWTKSREEQAKGGRGRAPGAAPSFMDEDM